MANNAQQAVNDLFGYLGITADDIADGEITSVDQFPDGKKIASIEGTEDQKNNNCHRGFVYESPNGEKCVIFVDPISFYPRGRLFHIQASGRSQRKIAYDCSVNKLKFFCFGVNNQDEDTKGTYKDYVINIECDIDTLYSILQNNTNNNDSELYIPLMNPEKPFERIKHNNGVFLAIIHKSVLQTYIKWYDSRLSKAMCKERNRIIFGAPGTGKSYMLNQEKDILLGKIETEKYYERVTFHPDYSYANFVGTYKPVSDGTGEITYEYVPGPFMRVLVKALKDPDYPYLLIIEEINRANVAAVFGDVFQLLDRNSKGDSEYSIQASEDIKNYLAKELGGKPEDYSTLSIPSNMYIWATMNSADQGVFPMDTAFKRRWDFTYLGIDENAEKISEKNVNIRTENVTQSFKWDNLRRAINDFLAEQKINEDKQLGPYFIPADKINDKDFCEVFKNKVLMYLFEDAAKQKRQKLFAGCGDNWSRFSKICEEFDNKGIEIFNGDILKEVLPNSNSTSTTP